jgi:hypothetical protein
MVFNVASTHKGHLATMNVFNPGVFGVYPHVLAVKAYMEQIL